MSGSAINSMSRHQQLLAQTHKWVGQTFYGTILKQMHSSPFKSEIFEGGRGGQMFGQLLDQHLAERMSKGAGGKLAESIVKRLEGRRGIGTARHEGTKAQRHEVKAVGGALDVRS